MNERFKLYCGDCVEYMQSMPTGSVDLIITDPPYGKKADKGTNGYGAAKNRRYAGGWDSTRPQRKVFEEMFRVAKAVICFGGNYFADMLPPSTHWVYWDKKGDIKFQNPFADGELIYTSFSKPVKKIVFRQQGFITDSKDKRFHPTQKPSELVQMLVEMYSNPDAVIFDPFMGSGTTGIACAKSGRRFVGVELAEEYFEIAKRRINDAVFSCASAAESEGGTP